MSLTDAAVMFGPFSESFISLRNMDKFCVNLKQAELYLFRTLLDILTFLTKEPHIYSDGTQMVIYNH